MQDYGYLFLTFLVMGAISFFERALPFFASSWLKKQKLVSDLGDFLPLAIMVLLVVHSSTDAALSHNGLPYPEVCAIAITVLLQWFFKNALLSIFAGTALYVVLINGLI
ncbi:MAG: AzlD domain-containing protein [Burkholderiaceae bacterium]|nr:AzlD domain-containing protein [Burkholderiaceae bacterium]